MNNDDILFKDILLIIWQKKLTVIIITILVTVVSCIYAIHAKNVFTSNSKLLAKSSNNNSNQYADIAAMAGLSIGKTNNVDISDYLEFIVRDSKFLNRILEREWIYKGKAQYLRDIFNFRIDTVLDKQSYKEKKMLLDYFRKNNYLTLVKDKKTGLLTLTTNFDTPELAYDVNRYVTDLLGEYIKNSLKSQAKEKRAFIEERIKEVNINLRNSENLLAVFKERNAISTSPKIVLEEMRLNRDVNINQEVYIQLQKQCEIARIDEKNDQPLIEVIQNPELPIKKSKPQRLFILIGSLISGFAISFIYIMFWHWFHMNFGKQTEVN